MIIIKKDINFTHLYNVFDSNTHERIMIFWWDNIYKKILFDIASEASLHPDDVIEIGVFMKNIYKEGLENVLSRK